MTEPRPRLTNTIGSVQQTSVVNDDASPTSVEIRGCMRSSCSVVTHTPRLRLSSRTSALPSRNKRSDQQGEGVEVRRIVGSCEKGGAEAPSRCAEPCAHLHDDNERRNVRWRLRRDDRRRGRRAAVFHLPATIVGSRAPLAVMLVRTAGLHRGARPRSGAFGPCSDRYSRAQRDGDGSREETGHESIVTEAHTAVKFCCARFKRT
jgi:hypothetical protein